MRATAQIGVRLPISGIKLKRRPFHRAGWLICKGKDLI